MRAFFIKLKKKILVPELTPAPPPPSTLLVASPIRVIKLIGLALLKLIYL